MPTLHTQAVLHTRLFQRCLDGMDEAAARWRAQDRTNHALFVAAHLVDSRAWTARLLGLELPEPFGGALRYGTALDELAELPALEEVQDEWTAVSALLEARLEALTPEELTAPATQRFPVADPTLAGALAFLMHHEAYHIGQMALLRRAVGLPAMVYR